MIRVQAQHLLPGDYLPATKRKVTGHPQIGLYTPRGKVEVRLNDGLHVWGAHTLIAIERQEPSP